MKVSELQMQQGIRPLKPIDGTSRIAQSKTGASQVDFGSLLQNRLQQNSALKFSAHALKRLEARELNLNELDLQRLQQGVRQLEAKGAQNSVVLMDDRAFVVSVKNKTVITAIHQNQSDQKIFTNIDSLAIV
ncbi:MAG TPA: flagellar protein [Caldithrix abyssi]|uniref:Flagellar protein n=1 Tax=Caldithrix abyssi TaxID=187145 RepID=A0A7V5H3H1_CALAY|nr:flagellar protein [Caldithrix abyssi]